MAASGTIPHWMDGYGQAHAAAVAIPRRAGIRRKDATWWGRIVLFLLIASFSYELPLFSLTQYDRLNPRLFDIASLGLALYWLFIGRRLGWRLSLRAPVVWPWFWVTLFFGIATLASGFFIPFDTYLFSIFFFLKYIEVFVVVLIFSSIHFSEDLKRQLLWMAMLGGVWVSFYAILQYAGVVSIRRYLPSGEEINMFSDGIYSTLGVTYFHLGMFGVLSCLIGFALFSSAKSFTARVGALCATLFCVIPALISGSKAGLVGIGIAIAVTLTQREYRSSFGPYILAALVLAVASRFYFDSVALDRLERGNGGTPEHRLMHGVDTLRDDYDEHGAKLLLVGGGFYVAPLRERYSSELHYRIGYGNHNIFLFPLEQAGLGAFLAAFCFWISVAKNLTRRIKESARKSLDGVFATSMRTFFIVIMIVGIAGQVFFLGFGTEHFTVYQILLYVLASSKSRDNGEPSIRPRGLPPSSRSSIPRLASI